MLHRPSTCTRDMRGQSKGGEGGRRDFSVFAFRSSSAYIKRGDNSSNIFFVRRHKFTARFGSDCDCDSDAGSITFHFAACILYLMILFVV